MTHETTLERLLAPDAIGAEIVFDSTPSGEPSRIPGFSRSPLLVDCRRERDAPLRPTPDAGDPCRLPFRSSCLDYVAAAGVLARLPNPVAALAEWYRVLRPGGLLHLVIPDRRFTADHTRPLTKVEAILQAYVDGNGRGEAARVDEFVYEMDWSRYAPDAAADELPGLKAALARRLHEALEQGATVDIPFYTFELENLLDLVIALRFWSPCPFDWDLVEVADRYPESDPVGVLLGIRAQKGWLSQAEAQAYDAVFGPDRAAGVLKAAPAPLASLLKQARGEAAAISPPRLLSEYIP